jgi:hypothetical protein
VTALVGLACGLLGQAAVATSAAGAQFHGSSSSMRFIV